MPSVFAIVSRKVFDSDARVLGSPVAICDVWPLAQYLSTVAALKPLEAGGSLFVCTVRPPDERLWLVAVLEQPTFDGQRWSSAPNAVAVTDVSSLVPLLRFSTGGSINAQPGKLGMSLQTPRVLTADDEMLIRGLLGVAASPVSSAKDPKSKKNAAKAPQPAIKAPVIPMVPEADLRVELARRLGPAVADPLFAALDRARAAPAAAAKRAKETAKALGITPEALLVLDYTADVLLALGKGDSAGAIFGAARTLEKKLGKAAPRRESAATLGLYCRFAASGAVDDRSLTALATTLAKIKGDVAPAFADLVGQWAAGGGVLNVAVIDAVEKIAIAHKCDALELLTAVMGQALTRLSHQGAAEPGVWVRLMPAIAAATSVAPHHTEGVLDLFPRLRTSKPWRDVLDASAGLATLGRSDPARVTAWLEAALAWRVEVDTEHILWLDRWLAALKGLPRRPLALPAEPDPELVELCLAHGFDLSPFTPRTPQNGSRVWWLVEWETRPESPTGCLARVEAHPHFGPLLRESLAFSLRTRVFAPKWTVVPCFDAVASEFVAFVNTLCRNGTVAAWDLWLPAFAVALSAESFAHVSGLREALEHADIATAVRNTMRHGIMDEWRWPSQEKVSELLGRDSRQYDTDGPFPYWAAWDTESHRVVVVGPEGVAREGVFHPPEGVQEIASMRWVPGARGAKGDLLVVMNQGSLTVGAWMSAPTRILKADVIQSWANAIMPKGGGISTGGPRMLPGDEDVLSWFVPVERVLDDGEHAWRAEVGKLVAFDPMTGSATGGPLPAFFDALDPTLGLNFRESTVQVIPASLEETPLGHRDRVFGWRAWTTSDGREGGDHIDGRTFSGPVLTPHAGPQPVSGLFRFPERGEDCPLVKSGGDLGVWTADGRLPIVPPRHVNWFDYWFGAPQWLPRDYWHYLVPASPAASRALRDADLEQAEAVLAAAREGVAIDPTSAAMTTHRVSALVRHHNRTRVPERIPLVLAAIEASFAVAIPPRTMIGLANIVSTAAKLEEKVEALRQLAAQATERPLSTGRDDAEFQALVALFGAGAGFCRHDFEGQFRAVSTALAVQPGGELVTVTHVPESGLPWFKALAYSKSIAWRVLAPGTPAAARVQLAAALALFAETDLLARPERYRVLKATFHGWPAGGMSHDAGQKVLTWNGGLNRYFVSLRHFNGGTNLQTFEILECTHDGVFRDPPGFSASVWQMRLGERCIRVDVARKTLALMHERGPFGHDAEAARAISACTGLLYAGASLLLAAAWQPWDVSPEVRRALGLKVAEAELGRDELDLAWHETYQLAFPDDDPARLYEPQRAGPDGRSLATTVADTVVAEVGVRTPLPTEVIARLQSDLAGQRPYHMDVRVLQDPGRCLFLTQDVDWVVRPWTSFKSNLSWWAGWIPPGWPKHAGMPEGEVSPNIDVAFSGWVLRHFLAYLAWAQVELPRGDVLRLSAARLAGYIGDRLKNPQLLLLAGAIDLSLEEDPALLDRDFQQLRQRFDGVPYVATDGLVSASGLDRGDLVITWPEDLKNSLFFAFRPALLDDPQALARLAEDLGFGDAFKPRRSGCICGLNFGSHRVVDFTDLGSFVTWARPAFQRLVELLSSSGSGFDANPCVTAPDAVAAIQERYQLELDAAVLLLQLRALPEPTDDRVCRWNDWSRNRYDAAASQLLAKSLAVEARYDRTKRVLFAPGPVAQLAAPAAPMEASKLALYGLEVDDKGQVRAPFGVVLPLTPLGELFGAVV